MMTYAEALRALESMPRDIYEHRCAEDGCNLLEQVKAVMEQLYKDVYARGCMVCSHRYTPILSEPCRSCHKEYGELVNWQWRGVDRARWRPLTSPPPGRSIVDQTEVNR